MHKIIPVTKMTLHFTRVTLDDVGTLPHVPCLATDVLFIVGGRLHVGYFHANGCFYSGKKRFRAAPGCCQNRHRAVDDPGDGVPTHWCYFPTKPHPDFIHT